MSDRKIYGVPPSQTLDAKKSSSVVPVDDGGPAPNPLSIPPPPNTAGYTTRTITEIEANGYTVARDVAAQSALILELDDATDYVISSPLVIRRSVIVRGGRNIVWKACHIQLNQLGLDFFPSGDYVTALDFSDGVAAQSGRIIHLEGHWYEGADLGDSLVINTPTAHVRMGYWRVTGGAGPRSTDAAGNSNPAPPTANQGVRMYQGVDETHADLFKANNDYLSFTCDRVTCETSVTAFHFDNGASSVNTLRRSNVRAVSTRLAQEGPLGTESQAWTLGTNRATMEVNEGGFTTAVGGSTISLNTTSPLSGAQHLQVTRTDPTVAIVGAQRTISGGLDWSEAGAATALSCLVRVNASTTNYPMMRIDVANTTTAPTSGHDFWYIGQSHNCTVGVTRRLVCPFPREILADIRKVRVVLLVDDTGAGSGTHTFDVDDIASGQGVTTPTFTGPTDLTLDGKWAITHSGSGSGDVYIKDFYSQSLPGLAWKNNNTGNGAGTNYKIRYWDFTAGGGAGAYVLDPPPGDATHEDFYNPSPVSTGTDGTGNYAAWTAAVAPKLRATSATNVDGSAKVYDGLPPGGDYCPAGIAGQFYTSPAVYLNEPITGIAQETDTVPAATVQQDAGQEIAGGVANESDTAPAGTKIQPQAPVSGGVANESDTALAATKVQPQAPVSGGVASEADSALAAGRKLGVGLASESDTALAATKIQPQAPVAGGVASEADTATAATVTQPQAPVAGGVASESDTALAAAKIQPQAPVSGGVASEADAALAATKIQPQAPVSGGVASEADSALAAATIQPQAPVSGGVASESDTVLAATKIQPQAPVSGGVASEADAALAATTIQPQAPVSGGVASESDTALSATVNQDGEPTVVSGGVASEADAGVTASVTQPQAPVSGGVASEADAAVAGAKIQPQAPIAGGVAQEADSGPAATVDQESSQTISGGVASELDAAIAAVALGGATPPDTSPTLGGYFDETVTGGVVVERRRGGLVLTIPRGGIITQGPRGGEHDETTTGGSHDQTPTGGVVH